jgi:hypothetical protein
MFRSNMVGQEKLTVMFTIKMTKQEKANLDKNVPILSKQLKKQKGDKITKSLFLRLVAEDLHEKIAAGERIVWPPRLEVSPKNDEKPKPKKS